MPRIRYDDGLRYLHRNQKQYTAGRAKCRMDFPRFIYNPQSTDKDFCEGYRLEFDVQFAKIPEPVYGWEYWWKIWAKHDNQLPK